MCAVRENNRCKRLIVVSVLAAAGLSLAGGCDDSSDAGGRGSTPAVGGSLTTAGSPAAVEEIQGSGVVRGTVHGRWQLRCSVSIDS